MSGKDKETLHFITQIAMALQNFSIMLPKRRYFILKKGTKWMSKKI